MVSGSFLAYWGLAVALEVGGGGGKKVLASSLALFSLSSMDVIMLASFVCLRDGILGFPPLPGGLLRYLFAVQSWSADISSK